jgi:hypothetical protein
MRKISAEMPSNPQQNDLGMESNALIGFDVALRGSAMRTVSFVGSAMTDQVTSRKMAKNSFLVTR